MEILLKIWSKVKYLINEQAILSTFMTLCYCVKILKSIKSATILFHTPRDLRRLVLDSTDFIHLDADVLTYVIFC